MSQRERQPVAGVVLSPAAADGPAPLVANGNAASDWNSLFPALLPIQQQALLALALRQGCLRAGQIPNGVHQPSDRARAFFTALLQDSAFSQLAPFQPEPIQPIDGELDAAQQAAVAIAIQTPDLAVIRGLPGTGKSRVIAEIVRQSARAGRRVLVVASCSAGLDLVLERVGDDASVVPLRCVSREERADHLPSPAANRTFASYRRHLAEEPIRHVRLGIQRSEAAIARWRADLTLLDRILPVAEKHQQSAARRDQLNQAVARIALELEHAADGPIALRLRERQLQHASILEKWDRELAAAMAQLHDLQKQVADAEASVAGAELVQADRGFLQRLLGFGAARLQVQIDESKTAVASLLSRREQAAQFTQRIADERDAVVREWEAEKRRLIDEEASKRTAEREVELTALSREIGEVEQRGRDMTRGLSANCPRPEAYTPAAVEQVRLTVRESIERENQEVSFARRWCDYLAANADALLARLQRSFNAVFALPAAIQSDERLAELTRSELFDLVVVDESHQFSEAELVSILRRAARWALVGEHVPGFTTNESSSRWNPNGEERRAPSPQAPATLNRSRATRLSARTGVWPRLGLALDHEIWVRDGERLCCRLRPISPVQRLELEIESVADSPDIELRILTPNGEPPTLVEVSFPASATIRQALEYLYRESIELPVPNVVPFWQVADGRFSVRFANEPPASEFEPEPGLRLQLSESGTVIEVDFEPSAGWDRKRATAWLRERTRPAGSGRLVDLTRSHRTAPPVLRVVSPVWFDNRYTWPAEVAAPSLPNVEFVPVPAAEPLPRRNGEPENGHRSRAGTGLETDLSDARQRDHLTRQFHSALPARGLVNLSEARTIVHLLEQRLADFVGQGGEKPGSIAVLTLHAAQAELIRALARESPLLARPPIPMFLGHALEFRQREADLVIVSFARSNERRTVSYADDPSLMALAVTRARHSLILVGDPAMLARRAHWDGPADHQDEWAAEQEKNWVGKILDRWSELRRLEVPLLERSS